MIDLDKFRSIGYLSRKGATNTRVVPREDGPGAAGAEIEHWDDHVDAVATPETVRFKLSIGSEEK